MKYYFLVRKYTLVVLLLICCLPTLQAHDGKTHVTKPSSAASQTIKLYNGQAVPLDFDELCAAAENICIDASYTVIVEPVEGILFRKRNTNVYTYQHAGTSSTDDKVAVAYKSETEGGSFEINLDVDPVRPSIIVVHPQPLEIVASNSITVFFNVIGTGVDHVHVSTDGKDDHKSIKPEEGQYTLADLTPGEHTVTLSLAAADHRTIPGSAKTVTFTVPENE